MKKLCVIILSHSCRYLNQGLRPRLYQTARFMSICLYGTVIPFVQIDGNDVVLVLVVRYTIHHVGSFFM